VGSSGLEGQVCSPSSLQERGGGPTSKVFGAQGLDSSKTRLSSLLRQDRTCWYRYVGSTSYTRGCSTLALSGREGKERKVRVAYRNANLYAQPHAAKSSLAGRFYWQFSCGEPKPGQTNENNKVSSEVPCE